MVDVILSDDGDPLAMRTVDTTLESICRVLGGSMPSCHKIDEQEQLIVTVGAMGAEGFQVRLNEYPPQRLLVVSGNRPTIQLPAIEKKVCALMVTGGYELSPGLLKLAELNGVTVIYSPHDTATTTMLIRAARSIESAIRTEIVTLCPSTPIDDAKNVMEKANQSVFPVIDDEGALVGVVSKGDLINPPRTRLVLVDHNELDQAVQGLSLIHI